MNNHIERSPFDLLLLLKRHLPRLFKEGSWGMCGAIYTLHWEKLISMQEFDVLHYIINTNKPRLTLWSLFYRRSSFYYRPRSLRPRLRWINRIIKLYYPETI